MARSVGTARLWLALVIDVAERAGTTGPVACDRRIQPPAYTGLDATTAIDPAQLQSIEGAVAELSIESATGRVTLEQDGAARSLERGADGRFTGRVQLTKTGYLLVTAAV